MIPSVSFAKERSSLEIPEEALQIQFEVTKYQLENGLTVILHEDKNASLVNFQTWFKVGSKDDPPQRTEWLIFLSI